MPAQGRGLARRHTSAPAAETFSGRARLAQLDSAAFCALHGGRSDRKREPEVSMNQTQRKLSASSPHAAAVRWLLLTTLACGAAPDGVLFADPVGSAPSAADA